MVVVTYSAIGAFARNSSTSSLDSLKEFMLSDTTLISVRECLRASSATLLATKDFRSLVHDLLDEWDDLIHWLSYRYMQAFWLGLVSWRQSCYTNSTANHTLPFLPSKDGYDNINLLTKLTKWRVVPRCDSSFYQLQCALFRDAQNALRGTYMKRLKVLEKEYRNTIGTVRINWVRETVLWTRGRFETRDKFDREMDVEDSHIEGEERFGQRRMVPLGG